MKKHLLFNQSFGTVGSPNQTDETLTRENRIGLMSYLRRTLMLLFAVLVMSVANIGMAWGDTELVNINISSWSTQSVSAGGSVSGCYFKSAATITNGSGWVKTGNASKTQYYIGIPLSNINGSVTITVSHKSSRPTMGYELVTGNSAYNGNYSHSNSMSTTRIGSNGTTTTITINNLSGSYGHLILGATGNANNNDFYISNIVVTTPASSCASNPADPTGLAVSNITQGGATFTITDGANTNNYEIVCKTTSGAPAVDATPTKTGTDKTLAVTGLEDGTTYYAWVRSVCDASHKSSWVALGSSTFTTKSCSISSCGNATLTYPIYTSGNLTTSNLFSGATSSNTTAVSVGSSPAFTGVTVSAAAKGSSANAGACYAKSTALTGKMLYSTSSKSSSYYIDFPFTVNTGYTFTPCDVQVVIQPVSSNQAFTVEITDGTNVYGTSTATLNAGVMEPIIGLTSTAEMSAGNYAIRLYPHGGSSKEFRMGANVILKGTTASAAPSCTAPSSVGISGTYAYLPGQTLSLTATPTGHTGTPQYQWQKETSTDVWENITGATSATFTKSNCGYGDSGNYRCVVSTGATCSTNSSGYGVHVYSLNGGYEGESWTAHDLTIQSGTTGQATVHLAAGKVYEFKISSNCGKWYGNAWYTLNDISNWEFADGAGNMKILTGPEGDYTFTVDVANGQASPAKVSVSVAYPSVSHPNAGYVYITKWWDHCYVHYWNNSDVAITEWNSDAEVTTYTTICGNNYYYMPALVDYHKLIIKDAAGDAGNSTGEQVTDAHGGKYITHDGSWGWHDFTTYSITYIGNGGGGSMSATSGICPDASQAITSNAFTAPTGCASFAHWTANVAVKVGGETVAAGNPIANGATIQNINSNIILTAVWKLATPTITDNVDNTFSISGSMAGSSYYYTTDDGTPTTSSSLYSSAVDFSAGAANITAKAIAHKDGYVDSEVASQACTYHAPASLTALECNTRYTVQDMTAGGCGTLSTTSCYSAGLSANNRFEVLGDPSKTDQAGGTPEQKTNSKQTINSIDFTSFMYLKGDGLNGSTEPTCRGVKFIIPNAGKLTIYYRYGDRSKLKKEGEDAVNVGATTGGYGYDTHDVTAGTYYIYGVSSGAVLIAVEYQCCTTPAAPTAFAAGSITSTGATFTITDAANAASYDIYYSTSSTAPTAGTAATTTSTEKTKTVTGLTANTTYYAWVRSVCDADHKSAWFALGTTSFTTSAAEPDPLVHWTMKINNSAWGTTATATTDGTNITSINTSRSGTATGTATSATVKVTMASAEVSDNSAPDNSANFTFTVNSAKKVVPEKVTCQVFNVSSGNRTYKAQISDNNGHVYNSTNTLAVSTEATLTDATFNFASGGVLVGDVTLKIYAWKTSGSQTEFRMGQHVKLFGEVDDYNCTALNLTRGGQENGTYTVGNYTGNPLTCTVNAGEPASYQWKQYTLGQGVGEAVNAVGSGSTTTSFTPNPASANTYFYACEVTDICGNTSTTPYTGTFVFNTAVTYSVTHSLTNVTATSGATGAGAATEGVAYDAVFAANTGYVLPSTITVTIGGSSATVGTGYTWNASTGAFQVPAAQVTGAIVITIAGETAPATKDIYYGAITITAGALTKGSTGTVQFFTNTGGTIANNTEISLSTTLGAGSEYYLSNDLTGAELSKSSNWTTSSSSNRYVQGVKFGSGKSYTLALGSKVASSITFYGINGSASKTMTIGGQAWTSSSTKNTFAKHEFTKSGGFTGNVSITQDGDFYGILVITIQTATPCTTPVIPTLSNQTVCPGSDIAAWDATQTAVLADGETASYSWKKKGNDTELANTATFDLGSSAAESQAGTYVVTVTVSKAGKASATATKEVTLTVTAAVEEPVITANKATVYPGNSVTLTATCGTDGVTWNWYLCANADGTGAGSSLGTSSSYTIASAGATGTYYYKAVATGSCGTAERVYTLTVTAASECEKYFWFVNAADATTNGVVNNRDGFFTGAPTGSSNSSTYKFTLDGTEYKATKNTGSGSFSISFTIPEGSTATMGINCKGSSSKPLYLTHSSGTPQKLVSNSSSNASCTVENITEGTWTLTSAGSWTLAALGVQVCTTSSCTDATPTITAANTTVCVGSELSISSTGYETGATFQWQKLNSSTSTWDNISGATSATYTATAAAEHAGSYRLVATKGCARTSNTVTIAVPSVPDFGSTVPASVSVMQTIALSINTVEATDATKYKWYKSADATWDAGDTEIGTSKELIKAYDGEAIGSPSYYIFCRAQNACGITTSTAIAVNVTEYVEEDCATRGNEGDAEFGFENSGCGQGTYNSASCWTMNSNSKKLVYAAPDGKYFKTMKVTIASSSVSKASYNWSTDGGTTYTGVAITGLTTTLTVKAIDLSAHGNVNSIQIGRNFDDKGESSGTLYVSKICFEYTDACTATTVSPSTESTSYVMGGAWSNPTFTLSVAGTLTYSSSNEDIASVDDDGTVTFNGEAGTVTITAAYAGNATYCASEGSYTITVSCEGGAPKVVADGSVNMSGCNSSVILNAKTQAGADFADGTYQWFRNGEEIDGATSSSYTATQAGTYTVARTNTSDCTTPSTNSAIVTSETTEPEVERLVPFQYYHVDKTYSDQMKMRHLFAVKNSGTLDGKHFKMYVSRNGGAAMDVTSSNALVVVPNGDGHVDTVMVDLNKLSGKYSENDELVFTCKAIDCTPAVSETYKATITMNVIGATPTLALICSGTDIAAGTRETKKLTVGGDFLTGYNKADLCQQTGNTSFDANTEWGLYTRLKENYIVTPVNGYAVFNKLNYEPFDILLLTDYPKASKSDAAKDVLDDMADLCDYRPMLSFKTHMVAKSPSKWAAKGFTTSATENKADGKLNLNIVCYAHPMFESIKEGENVYDDVANSSAPLVYTMLTDVGHEGKKGMQGFELAAAENFVTIGLTHYNATIAKNSPSAGQVTWTPGSEDRMLVTVAERQTNIEARFILFSLNCGAQSMLTEKGRTVILKCLEYLLETDPLKVADCSFTFDNGDGNKRTPEQQAINCSSCPPAGDGKWSNPANWGPDYRLLPGEFTSVRIKKPVEVDMEHAHVMEVRIIDEGSIDIPANKALDVKSTIRRMDGTEIYPTDVNDIHIGSASTGNGTLIFNNNDGDTKAQVDMYSTAKADAGLSAAASTWQYIGTPHSDVANARYNYYNSWLYQYSGSGWEVIPNGGPLVPFRGYCVTHPDAPVVFSMEGTLAATTSQDIAIPAGYTVIANSWVAPIDINAITDDDMEGISDKSIYFFNTGSDANGTAGTGTEAGTYRTTPIHSASYTGDWQIPSMQGFYISTTSAGTLHLDYERHVRPHSARTVVGNPMYAPRRAAAESDEPNVLKIFARGSRYQDKLVVLEREDFTRGYDSGWDGEAWGGGTLSPMVYVTGEGREDAVSAIPEFEGTVIAFKAGEDSEYRFEFTYSEDAEPLYLLDTENNTYTQIMTGNAYYFTTSDKSKHARFILTRKSPQITTGVGNVSGDEVQGTKAKKLLIEDKMFIMVNGVLYDVTGKVVK